MGGELDIPTLDGKLKLKVPAETQSDKLFRLRGKGVKSVRHHGPGDLFCRVNVETPVSLSKRQKELMRELEQSMQEKTSIHSPKASTWLKRVKHFIEDMKF